MRRSNTLRIVGLVAIVLASVVCKPAEAVTDLTHPVLISGAALTDKFLQLTTYYWYAEERAPVSPSPVYEIRNARNQKVLLFDVFGTLPKARSRKRFRGNNSHKTQTLTKSLVPHRPFHTMTQRVVRYSTLQWWVTSKPAGAGDISGPHLVEASPDHTFIIPGMVFPLTGYYNVRFNVSFYDGGHLRWNQTVFVNPQPQKMSFDTIPAAYNGSAFDPAPEVTLRDFLDNPIHTSTPLLTFQTLASPTGSRVFGTFSKKATYGSCEFKDIAVSIPGVYSFQISALLTDGTTIRTSVFTVTVQKALPQVIVVAQPPTGVTRFVLLQNPIYRLKDSAGFIQDTRVNLSVALGFNQPSVLYVGLSTLGQMTGTTRLGETNYSFAYTDLSIDLPGTYEIVATLFLNGDQFLTQTTRFFVDDLPTWDVETLAVNTIGQITIYGSRPKARVVRLKLALDQECTTFASDIVTWPAEASQYISVRNVSFVPFDSSQTVFVCLSIPSSQSAYVPLLKHYLPSFNELFPTIYSFPITSVASCSELTAIDALRYQIAGWDTAQTFRRYGCKLTPPSAGTIPPCTCPNILTCEDFSHRSFTPPNLNIGRCVCCRPWIMAVAGCCTALFLLGILFVIYQWA